MKISQPFAVCKIATLVAFIGVTPQFSQAQPEPPQPSVTFTVPQNTITPADGAEFWVKLPTQKVTISYGAQSTAKAEGADGYGQLGVEIVDLGDPADQEDDATIHDTTSNRLFIADGAEQSLPASSTTQCGIGSYEVRCWGYWSIVPPPPPPGMPPTVPQVRQSGPYSHFFEVKMMQLDNDDEPVIKTPHPGD